MLIDISTLKNKIGQHRVHRAVCDALPLPADPEAVRLEGPVQVEADLVHTGAEILADLLARARVRLHCARCLSPFVVPLEARALETYRPGRAPEGAGTMGEELTEVEDGKEVRFVEGDQINLAPALASSLALELPMKPLCSPQCKGLCPRCGQNLNQGSCRCPAEISDIRWAVLQDLLKQKDSD